MIKNLTVENFFSFGNSTTISFDEKANVILGINGSGKTNFLKCLTLLYSSIAQEKGFQKQFSVEWGSFPSVTHLGRQHNSDSIKLCYEFDKEVVNKFSDGSFKFPRNPKYEITIQKKGSTGEYVLYEKLYNDPVANKESPFVYLELGSRGAMVSGKGEGASAKIERLDSYLPSELLLSQINDPDRYYPLYLIRKAILDMSIYYNIDTSKESKIRDLSPYYSEVKLLPKGENLISLLNYLNNNELEAYEKITEEIKNINPHFRELVFSLPTMGKTLLSLKENNMAKTISIENLSDGTLHYLILMAILYNPQRGKLVCIDEPEVGLHPDMINSVCKAMQHAFQNGTQVIVATHSPLLLNSFELNNAISFGKNDQNQTSVKRHTVNEFDDEIGLGQRWLNGQIGGVRW